MQEAEGTHPKSKLYGDSIFGRVSEAKASLPVQVPEWNDRFP